MAKSPAIGIDLGTNFSRVAVFQNGIVEIILNLLGLTATPSNVAFSLRGKDIHIGAKDHEVEMDQMNIIFGEEIFSIVGLSLHVAHWVVVKTTELH